MNRSNIGNIATNAMQTLNISGTAFAGMIRRDKADASSALNAQKKEAERLADKEYKRNRQEKIDARREELDAAKLEEIKAKTNKANARNEIDTAKLEGIKAKTKLDIAKADDLVSKTEARNLKIAKIKELGTPQAEEIAKKVESDISWAGEYYTSISDSGFLVPRSTLTEISSGGKSDGSKDV